MTQQDSIEVHRLVAETAAGMLDGRVPFLEGVRTLTSLLDRAGVSREDDDFSIFFAVDCQTDNLPVGEVRKHWATDALERLEPEIQAATLWAKEFASGACESLVARFGS